MALLGPDNVWGFAEEQRRSQPIERVRESSVELLYKRFLHSSSVPPKSSNRLVKVEA